MDGCFSFQDNLLKDSVFNEELSLNLMTHISLKHTWKTSRFQGGGDLLTKFGIDNLMSDISHFTAKILRFISQFLLLDTDIELGERPLRGPIYFPLTNNYFEIKFVEHEEPFYQLGKSTYTNSM